MSGGAGAPGEQGDPSPPTVSTAMPSFIGFAGRPVATDGMSNSNDTGRASARFSSPTLSSAKGRGCLHRLRCRLERPTLRPGSKLFGPRGSSRVALAAAAAGRGRDPAVADVRQPGIAARGDAAEADDLAGVGAASVCISICATAERLVIPARSDAFPDVDGTASRPTTGSAISGARSGAGAPVVASVGGVASSVLDVMSTNSTAASATAGAASGLSDVSFIPEPLYAVLGVAAPDPWSSRQRCAGRRGPFPAPVPASPAECPRPPSAALPDHACDFRASRPEPEMCRDHRSPARAPRRSRPGSRGPGRRAARGAGRAAGAVVHRICFPVGEDMRRLAHGRISLPCAGDGSACSRVCQARE